MSHTSHRLISLGASFVLVAFLLVTRAPAADAPSGEYKVVKVIPVEGDGRWDYLTVDPDAHRLYVPRSSHTQVIDLESGKVAADWADTQGVHGVALVPEKHLAFTSNGRANAVGVYDTKTDKKLADVKTGTGPDAILYDPASGKVLAMNHRGGTITLITLGADNQFTPQELEVGGALEAGVTDGQGHAWVNAEDKNEVVEIDTKDAKVLKHFPIEGGTGPTGLAFDPAKRRLYIGCGENNVMAVMDADSGKVLGTVPIGPRCDGTAFDPGSNEAFAACGDGTMTRVTESSDGKFTGTKIQTRPGARTIALDPKSHTMYLPTAEFDASKAGSRPTMKPGTFGIVVVGK